MQASCSSSLQSGLQELTKVDPDLRLHLAAFGINVATQTKTQKSITEMVR
jgi:hypothetical protein